MAVNLAINVILLGTEIYEKRVDRENLNLVLHLINTWVGGDPFIFVHCTQKTEWIPSCIPGFSNVLAAAGEYLLQLRMLGGVDRDLDLTTVHHTYFDPGEDGTYALISVTDTQLRIISYKDKKPVSCTTLSKLTMD